MPKLHFICGKMGAGKSTLAKKIATKIPSALLSEDELLSTLYPGEVNDFPSYLKRSRGVQAFARKHAIALLNLGVNVILDFPANTRQQREWFRSIFKEAQVAHTLHVLQTPDEICLFQLKMRITNEPDNISIFNESTFHIMSQFFEYPDEEERYSIMEYPR